MLNSGGIFKVNKEIPIIEDIVSKNKLTTGNENSIRWKFDEIILEYAKQNFYKEVMYFVQDSKKIYWQNNKVYYNNDVYTVLKIQNNEIEELEISKKDISQSIGVNIVFTIKEGEYLINKTATIELQEQIINMAKLIIDNQNINLKKYRKEGHLYKVTEELGNNRFLCDLTDGAEIEFEEVDIQKDLLDVAVEGVVLKYVNGKYEYYLNDEEELKK